VIQVSRVRSRRQICLHIVSILILCGASEVFGQQSSTGTTNNSRTTSGATASTRNTASASSGGSGNTAGTDSTSTDGSTGSRAARSFVGANQSQEFVGGARESTAAAAAGRQFRGINDVNPTVNQNTRQSGTPRQRPVALRVGFSFPPLVNSAAGTLDAANTASMTQFASLYPELQGVSVAVSPEGTATLSGVVGSPESSRLAANLIRHQPGIRRVENGIDVQELTPVSR